MSQLTKRVFLKYACDDESDLNMWFSESSLCQEVQQIDDLICHRQKCMRIDSFLDVVDNYSKEEFKKHFRLDKTIAEVCIDNLENANVLPQHSFGRKKVSSRKAFLMTLWYLDNQVTFRQLSDRFNCTQSAAWKIVRKVLDHLVKKSPNIIRWPTNGESNRIESSFEKKQGMKEVLGAIDGSHILIYKPGQKQHAYCNRKGTHSIILQGVIDDKKRFIDVFVGEPGSLHDSRVLKRSALYFKASNGDIQFYNKHLLGDSAYPSTLDWLKTPYKDNGQLTAEQRQYNYKHSSTRVVVENAFATLKGRFRRLRHFDNRDIRFIVKCVVAACTLHNICISYDAMDDDIELYYEETEVLQHVSSEEEDQSTILSVISPIKR